MIRIVKVTYLSFLESSIAIFKTFVSHVLNSVRPMLGASTRSFHQSSSVLLLDLLINLHGSFRTVNPAGLSKSLKVVNTNNGSIFVLFGISVSSASSTNPERAGSQRYSGWFATLLSISAGTSSQRWEKCCAFGMSPWGTDLRSCATRCSPG